jgi:formate dehydrogenase maturation protein FdhE
MNALKEKWQEHTARDWDDAEKLSLIEPTRWSTNLRVASAMASPSNETLLATDPTRSGVRNLRKTVCDSDWLYVHRKNADSPMLPDRSGRSLYYFLSLDMQAIALIKKAECTARDWDDAERTTID